ncbi:hypothetical protein FHS15_002362 [Paenibacillus castaneae]|nr:hypothetical protein [Paenibacillus castaneae]
MCEVDPFCFVGLVRLVPSSSKFIPMPVRYYYFLKHKKKI